MLSIFIVIIISSVAFFVSRSPNVVMAGLGCTGEECYGGRNYFTLVCTCNDDGSDMLFLFDYKTKQVLKLLYIPGESKLFLDYFVFGTYLLGSYQRSGDICSVGYDPYCADIEADGVLGSAPGSGTSL